jgi:hypothetical protein
MDEQKRKLALGSHALERTASLHTPYMVARFRRLAERMIEAKAAARGSNLATVYSHPDGEALILSLVDEYQKAGRDALESRLIGSGVGRARMDEVSGWPSEQKALVDALGKTVAVGKALLLVYRMSTYPLPRAKPAALKRALAIVAAEAEAKGIEKLGERTLLNSWKERKGIAPLCGALHFMLTNEPRISSNPLGMLLRVEKRRELFGYAMGLRQWPTSPVVAPLTEAQRRAGHKYTATA